MFFRSLRKNNSFARKAVALLVLCGVLFATAPIPIGWKPKSSASDEPFPCQDCHCGCLTPEQCWTSCCCYTPEERLAWAEEHGVEPPSYAVLVSKDTKFAANAKAVGKRTCRNSDCEHESAFCDQVSITISDSCCAPKRPACKECEKPDAPRTISPKVAEEMEQSEMIAILSISAMKCRGLSSDFYLLPWATVPDYSIGCSFPEPIVTPFEVRDEWLPSSNSQPDAPPPKFSSGCA